MSNLAILDELLANAWPPTIVEYHSGWRLRWTDGATRRANSVFPVGSVDLIPDCVSVCESFYRDRRASALFQVSTASTPEGLSDYLRGRGYTTSARTFVAHAATQDVIDHTSPGGWTTETTDEVTDDWFDGYWAVESWRAQAVEDAATYRRVLLKPSLPTSFVAARDRASVVAVGQVVVEHYWAGVQCMATRATHRRQGAASAVLHRLAVGAAARQADRMYLAVMADNAPALDFYRRASFQIDHEYSYFSEPPSAQSPVI